MSEESAGETDESVVEGRDYVIENGFFVFTREYLLQRGFCCGSGCRNCPYELEAATRSPRPLPAPMAKP